MGETLIAARGDYASDRFSPDCVKIFVDGVPTESRTAAMLELYQHSATAVGGSHQRGELLIPQAELAAAVTRFDGHAKDCRRGRSPTGHPAIPG